MGWKNGKKLVCARAWCKWNYWLSFRFVMVFPMRHITQMLFMLLLLIFLRQKSIQVQCPKHGHSMEISNTVDRMHWIKFLLTVLLFNTAHYLLCFTIECPKDKSVYPFIFWKSSSIMSSFYYIVVQRYVCIVHTYEYYSSSD